MEINEKKSSADRTKVLKAYRESLDSSLLIVSNVSTMGLNLDCANVLIIAVSPCFSKSHHQTSTNMLTR